MGDGMIVVIATQTYTTMEDASCVIPGIDSCIASGRIISASYVSECSYARTASESSEGRPALWATWVER